MAGQAMPAAPIGELEAIDRRTVRRSFDRRNARPPLHLVSALAAEHGRVPSVENIRGINGTGKVTPHIGTLAGFVGTRPQPPPRRCFGRIWGRIGPERHALARRLRLLRPSAFASFATSGRSSAW